MGPFEKIVDQIRGAFNFGVGLVGPGLCPSPPLKNPSQKSLPATCICTVCRVSASHVANESRSAQ